MQEMRGLIFAVKMVEYAMKIKQVSVSELIPYVNNSRTHSEVANG